MPNESTELVDLTWDEASAQIDSCSYLFAERVGEVDELAFSFDLLEGKVQAPIINPEDFKPIALLKIGARPIEHDQTCRIFTVAFDPASLISYTVLNESYGRYPEPPELFTGKLCRRFIWSFLLEFTERTTYARDIHPAPLQHYEFSCQNHVIDVIATYPPQVAVTVRVTHKAGSFEVH